jgi:integrase/recombinase XerD
MPSRGTRATTLSFAFFNNAGLRVSEAVSLQWRNLVDGIVNVRGKGGRARVVRLSRGTWAELQALRPADAIGDDRVFPMTAWNAWDRVRRAARSAGLEALVSPHFLRHSHGTHALRRRPGHRARDARACVALDHWTLPARPPREIQRRLPRHLSGRRRTYARKRMGNTMVSEEPSQHGSPLR